MAKGYRQSTVLGKYPVTNWRLPTTYEPDQPVYADEASYQASRWPQSGESVPGQNVVYGSSPTEQAIGQNAPVGEVPTVEGVEVDGGLNMKQLRDFANLVYPEGEQPTMEYGQDVNVRIPFTKRSLFKMSGKKMDSLAGAIAAAAQGAYVPGSDPGGQFLKGFLQGYGGVRSKDYAERKAAFETKKKEFAAQKEARSKLIGQLGLEGYKAMMKPGVDPHAGKILVTPKMLSEAKAAGLTMPESLVGTWMNPGEFVRSVPDHSQGDAIRLLQRQAQNQQAAQTWTQTKSYQDYAKLLDVYQTAQKIAVSPDPVGDTAIVKLVERAVDPATGVREGDVKMWNSVSGMIPRLVSIADKASGKAFLPPETRALLYQFIEQLHNAGRKTVMQTQRALQESAIRNNYDPESYSLPEAPPPLVKNAVSPATQAARAKYGS